MKYGCDLNCGVVYLQLLAALQEGLVTEAQITTACERLMTTRYMLGIARREGSAYDAIPYRLRHRRKRRAFPHGRGKEHGACAKRRHPAAEPEQAEKRRRRSAPTPTASPAWRATISGTSSRYVTYPGRHPRRPARARRACYYSQGSHLYKKRHQQPGPAGRPASPKPSRVAKRCDVTILCLGLDATLEGEEGDTGNEYSSGDKKDLGLPQGQRNLLKAVLETGKPVVLVLSSGSAMARRMRQRDAAGLVSRPGGRHGACEPPVRQGVAQRAGCPSPSTGAWTICRSSPIIP